MTPYQFARLLYLLFIGFGGIIAVLIGYAWWFFGAVALYEAFCVLVALIRWHLNEINTWG